MRLRSRAIHTPIGTLSVIGGDLGLRAIVWPDDLDRRVRIDEPIQAGPHPIVDEAARQLTEYFAAQRSEFDLPLDLVGTQFQQAEWKSLVEIPFGQTETYSQVAARLGRPDAIRAVGAANGRNPMTVVVPCHRVVGANGSLTGYAGGFAAKRWLLDHESAANPKR